MNPELFKAVVTIVFGAIAGGLTNTIAIWMLFHPYTPPKLFGRKIGFLQGAVPKNQPRLATAIGKTVGTRLLTEEDLTGIFSQPEFREAFDERLASFLHDLLEVERGSLRELLGPDVMVEIDRIVDDVVDHSTGRLDRYLSSRTFEAWIQEKAGELIESIAEEPVRDVVTPAREALVTEAVDDWIRNAVESDGFEQAVSDYVERGANTLLQPERTIKEIMPDGLVGSLEKAISGYLPLAIQRLGAMLENPQARERFEATLHEVLKRFLQDLKFHQRVVARLVMNDDTVNKVLDTIEAEGADRIAEMFQEAPVQEAMAKGIQDAIADLLTRPVTDVLGESDDPTVIETKTTLVNWVTRMAQDDSTRGFLFEKLNQGLDRASEQTWGQVLERVQPEKVTRWLVLGARSEVAAQIYRDGIRRVAVAALDRPIGRPARFLPDGAPVEIQRALGDPLWLWLQGQIPSVVQRVDVARRVEEKVLEFPMDKMEELVRRVTDRELRTIIHLGYALGAFIGGILVLVDSMLG
ncbi:MAG: DUF445 family protein [Longimicrobiales bacterium]